MTKKTIVYFYRVKTKSGAYKWQFETKYIASRKKVKA